MNDVNPPDLLWVGTPQNVQPNVAVRREADPDLQPEQPTLSPKRTTRRTTRDTGVPVPNFPNVQSSTLERSRRNRAAAEELLNQFRRETNDATQRARLENQQDA